MKAKAKETEKAREIENQAIVDMQESMSREKQERDAAKQRTKDEFKKWNEDFLSQRAMQKQME